MVHWIAMAKQLKNEEIDQLLTAAGATK